MLTTCRPPPEGPWGGGENQKLGTQKPKMIYRNYQKPNSFLVPCFSIFGSRAGGRAGGAGGSAGTKKEPK